MKSVKLLLGGMVLFLSTQAFSQTDSSKKFPVNPLAPIAQTAPLTVYKSTAPLPNSGKYFIPVLGTYLATPQSSLTSTVSIKVDEQNPGKIWVEGIAPEKFYAVLKTTNGTYKIPAQKTGEKTSIEEGVLLYDDATKMVQICVGCGYIDADPASALLAKTSVNAKAQKTTRASKLYRP